MKKLHAPALLVLSLAACLTLPARAELPTINENVWLGHYIGFEGKNFHFGFTAEGRGRIFVLDKKRQTLPLRMVVNVDVAVQETLPNGKAVNKKIQPASLESAKPAGKELKDVSIRGKVEGDAAFELLITEDRGVLSFGGKVLDPGTLKNPLSFGIRVRFPEAYPFDKKRAANKKQAEAFAAKIKGDRIQLKRTDGKNLKLVPSESVDASTAEVNGPGIASMEVEFSSHDGKKFGISASDNSAMTISNPASKPLDDGFTVLWKADPAKDPQGRARLLIEVK